jgi:shikimate kinase
MGAWPESRHVLLIGEMGTGKTSVGQALAHRLDFDFLDGDATLEAAVGASSDQIAMESGVAALHERELESFQEMLATEQPSVIAPAASVIDSSKGRELMRGQRSVWLTASPQVLEERIADGGHRRVTTSEERASLLAGRELHYERIALGRVDTTDLDPEDAASRVEDLLDRFTRAPLSGGNA